MTLTTTNPLAPNVAAESETFAATQNPRAVILESDLKGLKGDPKATAWDSFGEIEGITFNDGSIYWHTS